MKDKVKSKNYNRDRLNKTVKKPNLSQRDIQKRINSIQQIYLDHCYAAPFYEVSNLNSDDAKTDVVAEHITSNIRNNFSNLITSKLDVGIETNSNTNADSQTNCKILKNDTGNVLIKQEIKTEVPEDDDVICSGIETHQESTVNSNETNNFSARKNIVEICVLCASKNLSRKSNAVIVHFTELIKGFSGVDILQYDSTPTACTNCFETIMTLWNFRLQIREAENFIKNLNMQGQIVQNQNPTIEHDSTQFEYIDCIEDNTFNNTATEEQDEVSKCLDVAKTVEPCDKSSNSNYVRLVSVEKLVGNVNQSNENNVEVVKCRVCDAYVRKQHLNYHRCNHEQIIEEVKNAESYMCPICGKWYKRWSSFKRHEIVHEAKTCLCNICGDAFHHEANLVRHMRKHTGSKPYVCPYCERRFSLKWNLAQHKRLHTKILPYKCKLCSAAFRHNVTLKKHVARSHTADEFTRKTDDNMVEKSDVENQSTAGKSNGAVQKDLGVTKRTGKKQHVVGTGRIKNGNRLSKTILVDATEQNSLEHGDIKIEVKEEINIQ